MRVDYDVISTGTPIADVITYAALFCALRFWCCSWTTLPGGLGEFDGDELLYALENCTLAVAIEFLESQGLGLHVAPGSVFHGVCFRPAESGDAASIAKKSISSSCRMAGGEQSCAGFTNLSKEVDWY